MKSALKSVRIRSHVIPTCGWKTEHTPIFPKDIGSDVIFTCFLLLYTSGFRGWHAWEERSARRLLAAFWGACRVFQALVEIPEILKEIQVKCKQSPENVCRALEKRSSHVWSDDLAHTCSSFFSIWVSPPQIMSSPLSEAERRKVHGRWVNFRVTKAPLRLGKWQKKSSSSHFLFPV